MSQNILSKFPIKVGDESNVKNYASTLTNGEEQLLISRDGKLYLTVGDGSYKEISGGKAEGSNISTKSLPYFSVTDLKGGN